MKVRGPVLVLDQGELLGGAQLHALEVAGCLSRRGWEVGVVAAESAGPEYRRRVAEAELELEVVRMPRLQPAGVAAAGRTVAAALRLRSVLRRRGAALVVANTLRTQVAGTLAAASAGIPVVWIVHDFMFPPRLLPLLLPMVDRLAAVSESVAGFLEEATPRAAGKVEVIPNGIDVDRIEAAQPAEVLRDLAGGEFRFGEEKRYVGIVGHLHPRKGQDVFLRAAARFLEDPPPGPAVQFVMVGGVIAREPESETFYRDLRREAEERGVGSRLTFLGWQDDVPAILRRLDLLVSASRVPEGLGRTILEGFATGVPVAAAALGEPRRMIRHGENGVLFEPDDPDSLAETMRSVLGDPALARRVGSGGRRSVGDGFSLGSVGSRMEEVWLDAVAGGR